MNSDREQEDSAASVVCLDYQALLRGDDLRAEIKRAFGAEGLGILTVRGIPDFQRLRADALPLIRQLSVERQTEFPQCLQSAIVPKNLVIDLLVSYNIIVENSRPYFLRPITIFEL